MEPEEITAVIYRPIPTEIEITLECETSPEWEQHMMQCYKEFGMSDEDIDKLLEVLGEIQL